MTARVPSETVTQISVATDATALHTIIVALCSDNTIWRSVHVGDLAGTWSPWEMLDPIPLPVATIDSQKQEKE